MVEVMLPWPPKNLSPNARVHWAVQAGMFSGLIAASQPGRVRA